jgi:hypothetical protein
MKTDKYLVLLIGLLFFVNTACVPAAGRVHESYERWSAFRRNHNVAYVDYYRTIEQAELGWLYDDSAIRIIIIVSAALILLVLLSLYAFFRVVAVTTIANLKLEYKVLSGNSDQAEAPRPAPWYRSR